MYLKKALMSITTFISSHPSSGEVMNREKEDKKESSERLCVNSLLTVH